MKVTFDCQSMYYMDVGLVIGIDESHNIYTKERF